MTITALIVTLLLAACSASPSGQATSASDPAASTDSSATAMELPLPVVPDSLTSAEARASFIINHFWDTLAPDDTARTRKLAFMEPNFLNFVSYFPQADTTARMEAAGRFLDRYTPDSQTRIIINMLINDHLSNPGSPAADNETLIAMLTAWNALPLSEYELMASQYQLANALKNRVATVATDFRYLTREGESSTLSSTVGKRPLLLIFYDPDCDHCRETIDSLSADTTLAGLVDEGRIGVLAVYTEGDEELWRQTAGQMPAAWTVAIDRSDISNSGLYDIPEMPGLYILDPDGRVVLRNATLAKLLPALQNL